MSVPEKISQIDLWSISKRFKTESVQCEIDMEKHVAKALHEADGFTVHINLDDFEKRRGFWEAKNAMERKLKDKKCTVTFPRDPRGEEDSEIMRVEIPK